MSGISFGLQDEDEPFRPAWEAAPDETDNDLRPRQNPAGQGRHIVYFVTPSRPCGRVNGMPAPRGDVWARVGMDGPEGVYLHMVAEGP